MVMRAYAAVLLCCALAAALAVSGCRGRSDATSAESPAAESPPVTEGGEPAGVPPDTEGTVEQPTGGAAPAAEAPAEGQAKGTSAAASGSTATSAAKSTKAPEQRQAGTAQQEATKRTKPTSEATKPAETRPARGSGQGPASSVPAGERGGREGRGRRGLHERFDANGDGKLTAQELPEEFRERIMRADTNGDGAVTQEELQKAREAMRREGREGRGPGGEGRGPGALFERSDANGDGMLTAEELPERAWEWVMRADANGDGKVSREELEKAHQARGEGDRPHRDAQ